MERSVKALLGGGLRSNDPRRFLVDFTTFHDENENPKVRVMYRGQPFGDELTDNAYTKDGYGYHDAIHLSFAAVLGWAVKWRVSELFIADGNAKARSKLAELLLVEFFLLVSDVSALTAFPQAVALNGACENDGR